MKFNCLKCGNCCREFGNHIRVENPPDFYDMYRFVNFNPKLTIWDFEKEYFNEYGVEPSLIIYDYIKQRCIIINYGIDTTPCPHLAENNICKIYENRPLVCKHFPSPIGDIKNLGFGEKIVGMKDVCEHEISLEELDEYLEIKKISYSNHIHYQFNIRTMEKKLLQRYGEAYIYHYIGSIIIPNIYFRFLNRLVSTCEIVPFLKGTKENTYELLELLKTAEKIDISKLMEEYGHNINIKSEYDALKKQFSEDYPDINF